MLLPNDEAASKNLYQQKSVFKQFPACFQKFEALFPSSLISNKTDWIWVDMPKEIAFIQVLIEQDLTNCFWMFSAKLKQLHQFILCLR